MLYYLFEYLQEHFGLPGAGLFQYISFRAGLAMALSLIIAMVFGRRIIGMLQRLQMGETVRDLGLEGQLEKAGTPTMGGLIIIICILVPTLLLAKLNNIYVILMIVATVWMGGIGFLDDYIKVVKKNKEGLAGRFKVVGQVGLGLIVGFTLYFHEDVTVRQYNQSTEKEYNIITGHEEGGVIKREYIDFTHSYEDIKSAATTIPFVKNNELDYSKLLAPFGLENLTWILFVGLVIFIVTAVSNGANITDGIDGLAAGTSAIIGSVLAALAYVSGHTVFADYLNIMYIPNSGELVIYTCAFVGGCIGFLWFNSYPAKVFMGDTGSLCIGGIIAVIALSIRKELLIPVLCGVFLIENLSVMIQVSYFKYTRKKYGEGRRVFKMAPLHHHYQKLGLHEAKIVSRFWIVGLLLALVTLATLKIR